MMTTANNPNNNLSPWQPGQSGNPSGRPKGTRDLAGYVLETTGGGKELIDSLLSIVRGVTPNVPVQEGSRREIDVELLRELRAKGYGFKRVASAYTRETGEYISHTTVRARLVDG